MDPVAGQVAGHVTEQLEAAISSGAVTSMTISCHGSWFDHDTDSRCHGSYQVLSLQYACYLIDGSGGWWK